MEPLLILLLRQYVPNIELGTGRIYTCSVWNRAYDLLVITILLLNVTHHPLLYFNKPRCR